MEEYKDSYFKKNLKDKKYLILDCGLMDPKEIKLNGSFADLFINGLKNNNYDIFDTYNVYNHDFPKTMEELKTYQGIIVTGSKCDAHELSSWMLKVIDIGKYAIKNNINIVGICFGHQLLSYCIDGKSGRANQWEVGIIKSNIHHPVIKSYFNTDSYHLVAIHQDIVLELPKEATILAYSDVSQCIDMYGYKNMLCIQNHPEFTISYMKHRINLSTTIPNDIKKKIKEINENNYLDNIKILKFIKHFLDNKLENWI